MEGEGRGEKSECALTRGRRERERSGGQRAIGRNKQRARWDDTRGHPYWLNLVHTKGPGCSGLPLRCATFGATLRRHFRKVGASVAIDAIRSLSWLSLVQTTGPGTLRFATFGFTLRRHFRNVGATGAIYT